MDPNSVVQWERSVFPAEQKSIATPEPAKPAAQRKTDKSTNPRTGQPGTIRNGSSTQAAAETARPGSIAAIANRPIALREQPLFSAKKISSGETGAQVTILERKGDWVRLRMKDSGLTGFVRKEFLTPAN